MFDHCLPWPYAIVCVIDNLYGPHDARRGRGCDLHDRAMAWYWNRNDVNTEEE